MEPLATLISGLILAFATSYLTVRFALRQFYSQRWWEYKKQTYTELIEALFYMVQYLGTVLDENLEGRALTKEKRGMLAGRYAEAIEKLDQVGTIGIFMVSHKVEAILLGYRLRQAQIEREVPESDYIGRIDAEYGAAKQCLDEVKAAALEDLNVEPQGKRKSVGEALSCFFRPNSRGRST